MGQFRIVGYMTMGLLLTWLPLQAQEFTDASAAFSVATSTKRPVLLIFSGSDWCMPCIRFEKEVLSQPGFQAFVDSVVFLRADFPQRAKQSKALRQQNEALAAQFNPQGTFPHLVLLDSSQQLLTSLSTRQQSPASLIAQIRPWLINSPSMDMYTQPAKLMGTAFNLQVIAPNEAEGQAHLKAAIAEIQRLERLLSIYQPTSEVSRLNSSAGQRNPIQLSPEVYGLIERSKQIAALTQGAFDPTAGVLKPLYNFKSDPPQLPSADSIQQALKAVGYRHIQLQVDNRVRLARPGMKLDFGAIGKGFAADKAKQLLISRGVNAGVINASGDLTAWGTKPDGSAWTVGISDPNDPNRILLWLPLHNASIATSGNYEQFFDLNGQRYSHNIDPKSGKPTKGIKSVSVISQSAELSDALATAIFVMGVNVGLDLINQLPQVHCLIVDDQNRIFTSKELDVKQEPHE